MSNNQFFRFLVVLFAVSVAGYLYFDVRPTIHLTAVVPRLPGVPLPVAAAATPTAAPVEQLVSASTSPSVALAASPRALDPAALQQAFDQAMSDGNVAAALALFADDAVLTTPDGTVTGLANIANALTNLATLHTLFISTSQQVDGATETYATRISRDDWQAKGVTQLDATGKLVERGGKIGALTLDYSQTALAQVPIANHPDVLPKRGGLAFPAPLAAPLALVLIAGGCALLRSWRPKP